MSNENTTTFEDQFPYVGGVFIQGSNYRFPFKSLQDAVQQVTIYADYEAKKTTTGVLWAVWKRGNDYNRIDTSEKYGIMSGKRGK